tara:strand:+ start:1622 stop:3451 length:1830 start_codon:yes stop_codon:yes gene_type:complete
MPALLNWLLRLLPSNPICLRIVKGGSTRTRQQWIRAGFLGTLILVMLLMLLANFSTAATSLRSLATTGSMIFAFVSLLQVLLVCLLTPIFMAGAIAHEANPRTWEILLSTPLNSLQIVLGNLFGRLFFILTLLIASLPLFMVLRFFGGVPGDSIVGSFLISASTAVAVASIAVTLSVTRSGGRRAVFVFYAGVVIFLFATYALDQLLRSSIPGGDGAQWTTIMTPLNPFLALEVLLASNSYVPRSGEEFGWLTRLWLARPVATFCWLCMLASAGLILLSTLCVRIFARNGQRDSILRSILPRRSSTSSERPPRPVGNNAIAWRELHRDAGNLAGLIGRWAFLAVSLLGMTTLLWVHHDGGMDISSLRTAIGFLAFAQICIVMLTAVNLSATTVSREREDGTLDLILTTPIQPAPYLAGKRRGLVRYLLPMMLAPILSLLLAVAYVGADGFGTAVTSSFTTSAGEETMIPLLPWSGVVAFSIMFVPFIGFCVMVGLLWSIRSRGTIGSVFAAVIIVGVITAVLSGCVSGLFMRFGIIGPMIASISPFSILHYALEPTVWMELTSKDQFGETAAVLLGALVCAAGWTTIAILMHRNMSRTFMMTVRQLSGR